MGEEKKILYQTPWCRILLSIVHGHDWAGSGGLCYDTEANLRLMRGSNDWVEDGIRLDAWKRKEKGKTKSDEQTR